ncbi:putative calmodulin-binding protein Sha1 [Aspergillus clavatus NRRL 1]|uniref:Calmodulin-binding protein Sha1, putative n=1 Tax=Aspergillus clavatus (strain ATCC 1007 / CBS 513.65 / DSM 816 / NCTC 3887 / NRRL 1 / QM 1276 / 107) TaxID=344612 RepID=A1CRH1_ASPCL|nr:calmodulin-binding protein Sha1, putative [Aspergillus clavatus NRRL 1]EAW08242.1 calmodulin-binding protein Sha1, putative [Aspergillus clavatus NRRL 1]
MSGILEEVGTPCPPGLRPSRSSRGSNAFDSLWGDTLSYADETANLDFTTQIKQSTLIGVKPRRRTKTGTSFAIHDDNEGKPTEAMQKRKRENTVTATAPGRKSSLLAQPAQRFRPKVSFASSPAPKLSSQKEGLAHKRQSIDSNTETNRSLLMQINGGDGSRHRDLLKRDVRRNTVFIPPEDTTVASVFMDMFSPLKSDDATYNIQEDTEINSLEAQIVKKRQAKKAMNSGRKTPLQASVKIRQENAIRVDIAGKNTGKENVPPGTVLFDSKDKGLQNEMGDKPRTNPIKDQGYGAHHSPELIYKLTAKPIQTRQKPVLGEKWNNANAPVVNVNARVSDMAKTRSRLESSGLSMLKSVTPAKLLEQSGGYKHAVSRSKAQIALNEHPLITEDITNPAMYEDNWLTHQEVVITQMFNGLFDHMGDNAKYDDPEILRHELLRLYQSDSLMQLHKRIQASLSYGSMSIPKDVLTHTRRLRQDLGLKRKFLDIWLETYDAQALKAAIEAITGRKIVSSPKPLGEDSRCSLDKATADTGKMLRKKLERFLDVFLVQNKDMDRDVQNNTDGDSHVAVQAYRRTVLRSIMLVVLLDQARCCPGTMLPGRLFLTNSPFKSSAAVMQGLARLLLPASGDIMKSLGHLGCHLFYEQHRLQEYEYQMGNLAVDLRDGVRLTRIVELLLYPSQAGSEKRLASPDGSGPWPLSRRLKFPCLGRAVKLFNVQVALDALAATEDVATLISNIHAEDIVNGHREKTIALLWGLVSRWGLSELVEWDDVKKEIERLRQKAISRFGYEHLHELYRLKGEISGPSAEGSDEATLLLTQWVSVLAHLDGLRFESFSTGLANGKIYESIVNEYEGYILSKPEEESTSSTNGKSASLASRLQALGCSSQFANLLSPKASSRTHILGNDFTVGALAFLCSRLLSASKRARAAIVLQNAWRRVLGHREAQRRAVARHLAVQCAAVVQTQDRLLWAQAVIVQWWRTVKARRQRRDRRRVQTAKRDLQRGTGKDGRTRV